MPVFFGWVNICIYKEEYYTERKIFTHGAGHLQKWWFSCIKILQQTWFNCPSYLHLQLTNILCFTFLPPFYILQKPLMHFPTQPLNPPTTHCMYIQLYSTLARAHRNVLPFHIKKKVKIPLTPNRERGETWLVYPMCHRWATYGQVSAEIVIDEDNRKGWGEGIKQWTDEWRL